MSENTPSIRLSTNSVAESVAVLPVEISPATVVEMSPCVVAACDVDGGGCETTVVDISPANADKASVRVSTKAAQSCRNVLILFSCISVLLLLAKRFLALGLLWTVRMQHDPTAQVEFRGAYYHSGECGCAFTCG